jgi:acyl carrier protein
VTEAQLRAVLLEVLGEIAPEADLSSLDSDVDFVEQLEIDSMDLLNFAVAVHERLGVEIPEADYPRLRSLRGCLIYLAGRTGDPGRIEAGNG